MSPALCATCLLFQTQPLGYAYVLASALFIALITVRIGRYSNSFSSLSLASASTNSLALLSVGWATAAAMGELPPSVCTDHMVHASCAKVLQAG